jgi:hypothetical protein
MTERLHLLRCWYVLIDVIPLKSFQALLTKLHKKDLYTSKLNTLCELHISYGNYVEAALTVLLSADDYSWEDKPEESTTPTRHSKELQINIEPGAVTKERIYHKAIKYLSEGKYWELAIPLLQELRNMHVHQLHTQDEVLVHKEAEYSLTQYRIWKERSLGTSDLVTDSLNHIFTWSFTGKDFHTSIKTEDLFIAV